MPARAVPFFAWSYQKEGMDIQLDLSSHCIETELKRQYNRLISEYFKAGPAEKELMEATIDMLRLGLETLDFARLRARHHALCGGADPHKIVLSRQGEELFITIDDQRCSALDHP